jgi:hypothetical protein
MPFPPIQPARPKPEAVTSRPLPPRPATPPPPIVLIGDYRPILPAPRQQEPTVWPPWRHLIPRPPAPPAPEPEAKSKRKRKPREVSPSVISSPSSPNSYVSEQDSLASDSEGATILETSRSGGILRRRRVTLYDAVAGERDQSRDHERRSFISTNTCSSRAGKVVCALRSGNEQYITRVTR